MKVGSYGDVIFQVSDSVIRTFEKMKMDQTAAYTQHKVHGMKAVPEFTGFDCPQITFEITLSVYFGLTPKAELEKLENIMKSKKAYPLALGTDLYGSNWLITKISSTFKHFWKDGTLMAASVSITLLETEIEED